MTETLSEHTMLTLEDLYDLLETTENIEEYPFEYGTSTSVQVEYRPDDPVDKLYLVFGDLQYALTRDSAEQLFKQVKMPAVLLDNVPLDLTVPVLNWFLTNEAGSMKALLVPTGNGKKVASFCRVGTEIYSSVEMLDAVVKTMRDSYGMTDVVVGNVTHDLALTNYTLLFPQSAEAVGDDGDVLISGLNVQSSVTGNPATMIHAVTARDYHFNSMVSVELVGKWNRKSGGKAADIDDASSTDAEGYDVYDWMGDTAKDLWKHRSDDITNVKRLGRISLSGHSGEFLEDVFSKYSIPVGVQNLIRMEFAEQDEPTIFSLWNAVTSTALDDEVQEKPKLVRKLMEVGGELAHHPASCPSCHRITPEV